MTLGPSAVSGRRASARGLLSRESEIVIRVCVFRSVLRDDRARHATTTPTCPRRSRCAPRLSTIRASKRPRGWENFGRMFDDIVQRAFAEDLPDITSEAIFDPGDRGEARFLAKAAGVIAGLAVIETVFRTLDATAEVTLDKNDGDTVEPGDIVAHVRASVIALLSGERTALNLLQRASGIATATRARPRRGCACSTNTPCGRAGGRTTASDCTTCF